MHDYDVCDCGSTESLSKHLTTATGHVSFTHPMCGACRKDLYSGVQKMYAGLQPWFKPLDEQREYLNNFFAEEE